MHHEPCQQISSSPCHDSLGKFQLLPAKCCVALQRLLRTTDRASGSTALMPLRLDTAQAARQVGESPPRPAQKPGTSSAGSEQQVESMLASQPEQKLVPFVASARALYEHAPSGSAAQASAQSSPAAEGEAEGQAEHPDGVPEEQQVSANTAGSTCRPHEAFGTPLLQKLQDLQVLRPALGNMTSINDIYVCILQGGSTLQSQTSLAALLQSQESEALSSAKGCSPKASP